MKPAAFLGSLHTTRLLSPYLDTPAPHGSYFGEEPCRAALQANLGPLPEELTSLTQKSLQADLDQLQFDTLLAKSDIYSRGRLLTLSSNNHTSAWLKAPPLANLGLSIPSCEFSIATRIWLGIPSFQSSPPLLCQCGSFIDPCGDHFLGCSHGPLRIRRHDALRDVIFHSLLLDNTSTRREQRISGDPSDRPRDIYHQDFSDSKPTYFDLSVCNSLKPGTINNTASTAGIVGAQGEVSLRM